MNEESFKGDWFRIRIPMFVCRASGDVGIPKAMFEFDKPLGDSYRYQQWLMQVKGIVNWNKE